MMLDDWVLNQDAEKVATLQKGCGMRPFKFQK
jgi:hypothetical protein